MTACSNKCVRSKTFSVAKSVHVATIPFDITQPAQAVRCVRCDTAAKMMCARCHVTAYCSKFCILDDYRRHKRECKLHCPRLKLFQDFERFQPCSVRIKHTGMQEMGLGMYARKAFEPGERILEDTVHYADGDSIIPVHLAQHIEIIDKEKKYVDHAVQHMVMADGRHGFWTLFINHSCLPNSILELSDCKQFILLTAIHPISAGSQISVSYFRAVYTPLRIRTPILNRILGRPCICFPCLSPQIYTESACEELWNVMQHNYGVRRYEVLEFTSGKIDADLVFAVANRIIDIALMILGANLRAADPWLSYVYHAVLIYVEEAHRRTGAKVLSDYLVILRQDAATVSEHLGFCTSMLVNI